MRRFVRISLAVVAGLVVVLLGAATAVVLLAPDHLRTAALNRVSAAVGREVSVHGDFALAPSLTPTLTASDVSIANVPWGSRPQIFSARRLEIQLQLIPLLRHGEVRIDRLVVENANVLVERGPEGFNWLWRNDSNADDSVTEPAPRRRLAALTEVMVRDSRLVFRNLATGRTEEAFLQRLSWRADDLDSTIELDAAGLYQDRSVTVAGTLGAIDTLYGAGAFPLDLTIGVGPAAMTIEGDLGWPPALEATDLWFAVEDLSRDAVSALLKIEPPLPGPYAAQGRLKGGSEDISLTDLDLRAGSPGTLLAIVTDGSIEKLARGEGLLLPSSLQAASLSDLGDAFGVHLPPLGRFEAKASITGSVGNLNLVGLTGRVAGVADGDAVLEIADGRIEDLRELKAIDVSLRLEGSSTAALGQALEVALPALGPMSLRGRLTGSGEQIDLAEVTGTFGPEDGLRLRVENGSIADLRNERILSLPLRVTGPELAVALSHLDWSDWSADSFGPIKLTGTVTGPFAAPAVSGLEATAGRQSGATIDLSGGIDALREMRGLDLQLSVKAQSLSNLEPLIGAQLPASPSLRLATRLRGERAALSLADLEVAIGDLEASGSIELTGAPDRPRITGRLMTPQIDIDALADLTDEAHDGPESEDPAELPIDLMDVIDADLALQAGQLDYRGYSLRDTRARLLLADGEFSLHDLTARFAGGAVSADLFAQPAAQSAAADVTFRLRADDIRISRFVPEDRIERATGEIDIDIAVDTTGRTIDGLVDELEGDVVVLSEEGQLQDVPLNRLVPDLDIFGVLPFFQDNEPTIRVNCLVGEFDVDQGVAQTNALLDTQRMTLLGRGSIDLGSASLDLTLQPRSKSSKLSKSTIPLDIGGSLTDPDIRPRVPEAVGGAIRGFLGGLLIPINQISALFGDEAIDACGDALRQAADRRRARQ